VGSSDGRPAAERTQHGRIKTIEKLKNQVKNGPGKVSSKQTGTAEMGGKENSIKSSSGVLLG